MRFCAANFLQSALQLLRYGIRLLRGKEANSEGDCECCGDVSVSARRDHRRRAVITEKCAAVDVDAVRYRLYGLARNQRRARYLESRSPRLSDHGLKDTGQR